MATANVIPTAEMNAQVHIVRALEASIVELDVSGEHLVCRLGVAVVRFPALEHGL